MIIIPLKLIHCLIEICELTIDAAQISIFELMI